MSVPRRVRLGDPLPTRVLLAASLAIALSAAASPAQAQSTGERIIGDWADGLRGLGARVEWAGLSHAGGEDRLDVRDVAIEFPDPAGGAVRLTIPSASFVGLADRAEGGFVARSIRLPRLSVKASDGEVEIADVEHDDVEIPRFVFPAHDPDRPMGSFLAATRVFDPVRIGRAALGRLTLSATSRADPPLRFDLSDAVVTGAAGGRIEKIRVGTLSIQAHDAGKPIALSASGYEASDLAPIEWRRVLDDDAYVDGKGDGVWRRSDGPASVGPISLRAENVRLDIAGARSQGRWIRQFDQPIQRLINRFIRRQEGVSEVEVARIVHEIFQATRHEGWSLEGLHLAGPDLDHADLARISVGAFSGAGLDDVTLEGLDVVARDSMVRLGRLALRDLRLPDADDLRRAILAAAAGAEIDPSSLMPTLAHLAVDDLETMTPGTPAIRLASLRLDFDRFVRAVPTSMAFALGHFAVPVAIGDEDARRTLGRLGYRTIDVSAALRLAWDAVTREIVVDAGSLDIVDLGRLTFKGRLGEVPRSVFTRPETIPEAVLDMRVTEATATFFDASITDRLLKMLAEDQRMKPERQRRRVAEAIGRLFADIRDPARRRAVVAAIKGFIEKPGAISATIRPRPPATIAEIVAAADRPELLADRLDLVVSTERGGPPPPP